MFTSKEEQIRKVFEICLTKPYETDETGYPLDKEYYFVTFVHENRSNNVWVQKLDGDQITGKRWDEDKHKYDIEIEQRLSDFLTSEYELHINHHINQYVGFTKFSSAKDFLIHNRTKWIYIKLYTEHYWRNIGRFLFNRRELKPPQEVELLDIMSKNVREPISISEFLERTHGDHIHLHPKVDDFREKHRLLLEHLMSENEISEDGRLGYRITGKGLERGDRFKTKNEQYKQRRSLQIALVVIGTIGILLTSAGLVVDMLEAWPQYESHTTAILCLWCK